MLANVVDTEVWAGSSGTGICLQENRTDVSILCDTIHRSMDTSRFTPTGNLLSDIMRGLPKLRLINLLMKKRDWTGHVEGVCVSYRMNCLLTHVSRERERIYFSVPESPSA
jgi:hypothetical protein